MKTRRLTKKYKNKRNSKNNKSIKSIKRKNKSRKIILNGGMHSVKSVKPVKSIQSSIYKTPVKTPVKTPQEVFIDIFFTHLKKLEFPEALCALHTFYTCGITPDEINKFLRSSVFKYRYDNMFFRSKQVSDIGGGFHTNNEATERLMFFLSYIFKKIEQGQDIECRNGQKLSFTPGPNSFLKILKRFFGYLDTACVLTISYSIDQATFNKIAGSRYAETGNKDDKHEEVTNGQLALYDLVTSLKRLAENFPTMENDIKQFLALMTTGDGEGRVYSFNTTNMCTFIKMIQHLFTYFDDPESDEHESVEHDL
jgi:hypothetical protein